MKRSKYIELLVLLKPRKENNKYTCFHILGQSSRPLLVALSLLSLALSGALYMSGRSGIIPILAAMLILINYLIGWWSDVSRESGEHTESIKENIKLGMLLFIISEVMFFFGFFWSYIHLSGDVSVNIGIEWPSYGMQLLIMNPYGIPLLNTIILLGSGILITYVHITINYYVTNERITKGINKTKNKRISLEKEIKGLMFKKFRSLEVLEESRKAFLLTLLFALIFTLLQIYEYIEASFNISDSVFGSLFYMMTGFHGFHVIIGTIFLSVNFIRDIYRNISYSKESVGLECAIWYWHFVDVVWICLYLLLYWLPYEGSERGRETDLLDIIIFLFLPTKGEVVGIAHSGQLGFQNSASTTMDSIVGLHNYINLYLIVILSIVIILMYKIILHNRILQTFYTQRRKRINCKLKLKLRFRFKLWCIKLYFINKYFKISSIKRKPIIEDDEEYEVAEIRGFERFKDETYK